MADIRYTRNAWRDMCRLERSARTAVCERIEALAGETIPVRALGGAVGTVTLDDGTRIVLAREKNDWIVLALHGHAPAGGSVIHDQARI